MLDVAVLTVMPGAVAFAGAMDLLTMKIPNRISAVLVLSFFPMALLAGLGVADVMSHMGAALGVLALGVLLFIPGWFGGGDAKLMAAIALWVGPDNLVAYFLHAAVTGGFIAMAFSLARSVPLPSLLLGQEWALRLHRRDAGIPYGLALAAGALLVYPQTVWFTALAR